MGTIKRSLDVSYIFVDFKGFFVHSHTYSLKILAYFYIQVVQKETFSIENIKACVNLSRPMLSLQLYSASSGLAEFSLSNIIINCHKCQIKSGQDMK